MWPPSSRRATPPAACCDERHPVFRRLRPSRADTNQSAGIMRAHASPRCRRTFIPPRRPWNRCLHVHAHTGVNAPLCSSSACLLCVGGSPRAECSLSGSILLAARRWAWSPPTASPLQVFWTMFFSVAGRLQVFCVVVCTGLSGWHPGVDVLLLLQPERSCWISSRAHAASLLLSTAKQMLWR